MINEHNCGVLARFLVLPIWCYQISFLNGMCVFLSIENIEIEYIQLLAGIILFRTLKKKLFQITNIV